MAMNTWAAIDHGKVDTIGLCHGIQHGGEQIAAVLGASAGRARIHLLGHQSPDLVRRRAPARPQGRQGRAGRRLRAPPGLFQAGEGPHRRPQAVRRLLDRIERPPVRISALVPQAARTRSRSWIDMSDWIHGETGGYLRHSTETRNWFETDFPALPRGGRPPARSRRALDRACELHHRGAGDRPRLSRPLQRQEQGADHQPARGRDRRDARLRRPLRPEHGRRHHAAARLRGDLHRPRSACSACRSHAAVAGDVDLLKLAVLHDPLVGAICIARRGLADGRRDARRPGAMAAAICRMRSTAPKQRLARKTVATRDWKGAARQEVRPIETVRAENARRKEVAARTGGSVIGGDQARRPRRRSAPSGTWKQTC